LLPGKGTPYRLQSNRINDLFAISLLAFAMDDSAEPQASLVLGTAQLGMAYGIANRTGGLSPTDAEALVLRALERGVTSFDTARAYGDSEIRLGRVLAGTAARIITKLAPFDHLAADAPAEMVVEAVRVSIAASAEALGTPMLDTVLLHRARHLRSHNGAVWDTLLSLQAEGRIRYLGASVQTPEELRLALSFRAIRHVQMPLNLLDWRWRDPAVFDLFSHRPDVTVHARSIFLQGLLAANDPSLWPHVPGLDTAGLVVALDALAQTIGRDNAADLCLAYARGMPFLHGVVIGAETTQQLDDNVALAAKPPLDPDECLFVERFLPQVPVCLLNPASWPTLKAA
jgi:aryl-alcohol dehydrogenase-like predicted oxidoreductase